MLYFLYWKKNGDNTKIANNVASFMKRVEMLNHLGMRLCQDSMKQLCFEDISLHSNVLRHNWHFGC